MEKHSIIKSALILVISILTSFISSVTFAGPGSTFNNIVFFGDSLSDNGNLFSAFLNYLPKSPPYYEGRFSNGNVWSDKIANDYAEKFAITSANYAYGGETTIFHNPMGGYLPYTLGLSLDSYLLHSAFQDRASSLFVIWIGGNDYFQGAEDHDAMTTAVTDKIKEVIASIIYYGGKNFLIINLPDLSHIPYARLAQKEEELKELSLLHNKKLEVVIGELQDEYKEMNIQLYDINKLFSGVMENPDEYNHKYNTHFINTNESCWNGGYTLTQRMNSKNEISRDFDAHLKAQAKLNPTLATPRLNSEEVANFIVKSPSLYEAYAMSKAIEDGKDNDQLCQNPDDYFFWDHVHPTRMVHELLSKVLFDYIEATYDHA